MPAFIRAYDNKNQPIINVRNDVVPAIYFNVLRLNKNQSYSTKLDSYESVYVVMKGRCDFVVNGTGFEDVGGRDDIWSGKADSVYVPTGMEVTVEAKTDNVEVAVAGGICRQVYEPFRVKPGEVEMVDVGSPDTHSHRRIFHILGQNAEGRAGNLLVSELYCDGGCWSGYPSHKHDEDVEGTNGFDETAFEEVYYYRFKPENGFGGQFVYQEDGSSDLYMTQSGDTVLIDKGFHPTVTSPGHEEYIFTIIVGKTQRSLVQNFRQDHRYIMDKIPGIGAMRDKFK